MTRTSWTSPAGHGEAVEMTDPSELTSRNPTTKGALAPVEGMSTPESDYLEDQDGTLRATKSTRDDAKDMRRMGKDQQLVRNFHLISIMSFSAIATAAWEIGLFIITPGLVDGGRAGLIWSLIWSYIGFGPIYLSMAEMASMAPIAGSQYHWVSEFAPESMQKFLSYITGWTSTIAWQAGNALGIFLVGSLIQTIIVVNNVNYGFPSWQGSLLAIAAMAIAYAGCVYGAKVLHRWQNVVFAIHIIAFFGYIVPIWVKAPAASHKQVWAEFANEGGWSSTGLAVLVGQLSGISQPIGIDTAAHMSEEVRDAAGAVPKAMMTVYLINFTLIFIAIVTVCYHVPDLDAALADATTYPAIYVMRQSMSVPWITVMLVIMLVVNVASNIVYLTAVTRDLFAFARDEGLPLSKWLSTVSQRTHTPVNAAIFSSIIAILLSLIYIGSPVAFYAITSLGAVALVQCYSLSIGCILWRRIAHPETLPPAQFSLGRWGIPINASAVAFSVWSFFWCAWPVSTPVTASGFNWASPIYSVVLIVSLVYYATTARHKYVGPVAEVEGRREHMR